jgi:hypothetical protein
MDSDHILIEKLIKEKYLFFEKMIRIDCEKKKGALS